MKDQSNTPGKTGGIIGAAIAAVGVATYLLLPPPPMVNPKAFHSSKEGTSNWPIVYVWSYKNSMDETDWKFSHYTTNTTLLVVDATNKHRFFTITEYFLTGLPDWYTNTTQFRWKRTNQ